MTTQSPDRPDQLALFTELLASLQLQMMRYALILCGGDRHEADDVVGEASLNLWKRFLEDPDAVLDGGIGYAMTTVKNAAWGRFRYRGRHPQSELSSRHETEIADRDDTARSVLFSMAQQQLWAAVKTLPEIQMKLIFFRYVMNCSNAEAARKLGLSETTAARYIRHALETLKGLIAGPEEEDQVG